MKDKIIIFTLILTTFSLLGLIIYFSTVLLEIDEEISTLPEKIKAKQEIPVINKKITTTELPPEKIKLEIKKEENLCSSSKEKLFNEIAAESEFEDNYKTRKESPVSTNQMKESLKINMKGREDKDPEQGVTIELIQSPEISIVKIK